jgi:hypothetical protein
VDKKTSGGERRSACITSNPPDHFKLPVKGGRCTSRYIAFIHMNESVV